MERVYSNFHQVQLVRIDEITFSWRLKLHLHNVTRVSIVGRPGFDNLLSVFVVLMLASIATALLSLILTLVLADRRSFNRQGQLESVFTVDRQTCISNFYAVYLYN